MPLDLIGALQMLLTLAGMWCVNTPKLVKWGCVFGVISQPFWYLIAIRTGEIGVLVTTTVITILWLKGVWSWWVKPYLEKGKQCSNSPME